MISTLRRVTPEVLAEIDDEKRVRKTSEVFLLFTLGSQFDHLIKRMLDSLGVYCLVADPASVTLKDVLLVEPKGIILSGGPASAHAEPPPFDHRIFDAEIPVLGICLGFQLWAHYRGIQVTAAERREFGTHRLQIYHPDNPGWLLNGMGDFELVLQSHGDRIEPGPGMDVLGRTENTPVAVGQMGHLWGVQFHPEVTETVNGELIFHNFIFDICGAVDTYPVEREADRKIEMLREQIGRRKVLLAISGGSDSSVVAHLLKHAVDEKPGRIVGVYIRGIDRPDDEAHVYEYFGSKPWLTIETVDATDRFLDALRGVTSMHDKRVAMRGVYQPVLQEAITRHNAGFIAQGTLYTDLVESGGGLETGARRAMIKLHHNTGLKFTVPELCPLDDCVKDSARDIGRTIGVPEPLLTRHPFPGPGLVIRIEGEVTAERLAIARQADDIFIEELRRWELYHTVWQAGAVVTNSVTTCTKGDDATNGLIVALWAVWSVNGFTARAAELPWDFLQHVSRRITNEIRSVGAVVYRISDKPPATIEWG